MPFGIFATGWKPGPNVEHPTIARTPINETAIESDLCRMPSPPREVDLRRSTTNEAPPQTDEMYRESGRVSQQESGCARGTPGCDRLAPTHEPAKRVVGPRGTPIDRSQP